MPSNPCEQNIKRPAEVAEEYEKEYKTLPPLAGMLREHAERLYNLSEALGRGDTNLNSKDRAMINAVLQSAIEDILDEAKVMCYAKDYPEFSEVMHTVTMYNNMKV